MKRYILLMFLLLVGGCASIPTSERYQSVQVSRVLRVYDGDTFICDIDELPPLIGKNIRVRLKHIDTPEIRDKDKFVREAALIEKQRLEHLLSNAKIIELRSVDRCKYFRILSEVFIDGENILPKLNQKYVTPASGKDK